MQYYIAEKDWKLIYGFLRLEKRIHTKQEAPLRRFVEGIWYITRAVCQWRLLPTYYGYWRSVHRKFQRWVRQVFGKG
jgi:transposase